MTYHLKREVVGGVVNISLGMPEADAYLKFVRDRCRLNTVLSYGYDIQVFLNSIQKPVLEITPLDILGFIESQQSASNRQGRTNGLSIKGPGLSKRTIKRRLAAVSGFYEYLGVYHNLPIKTSPIPRGLVRRKTSWGNWYGRPTTTPLIRAPETLPRPLDAEEISPFIDSMRCHRDKAMVLLMLLAGLRKSEVLKLALDDIDFGQRTLTVKEGKGGHRRVVVFDVRCVVNHVEKVGRSSEPNKTLPVDLSTTAEERHLELRVVIKKRDNLVTPFFLVFGKLRSCYSLVVLIMMWLPFIQNPIGVHQSVSAIYGFTPRVSCCQENIPVGTILLSTLRCEARIQQVTKFSLTVLSMTRLCCRWASN